MLFVIMWLREPKQPWGGGGGISSDYRQGLDCRAWDGLEWGVAA